MNLTATDALKRVLEIRNSREGEALRSDWAQLVWDKKLGIVHGVTNVNISHVRARDINQTVFIVGNEQEARRIMPKMRMKNVRLTGNAEQAATNVPTDMDMDDLSAQNATQRMTHEGVDLNRLASELGQLNAVLLKTHPNAVSEANIVAEAKEHAEAGDGRSAKKIVQSLGKWVSKVAFDAGTEIAAKFIDNSIKG